MNLEETIEFLRTASDEDCNKFISERIKYLEVHESGVHEICDFFQSIRHLSRPSVYRFALNDNESTIVAASGMTEEYEYKFDDSEVLSKMLVCNIKELNIHDIEGLCAAVAKVVFDYFGSRVPEGTQKERFELIENAILNNQYNDEPYARLSAFKNSKNAWCAEKASVVHQLFKILGVESQIVCSPIETILDGKSFKEGHNFNMIRINGKTLMIDTALMDFVGERDTDGKFVNGNFEPFIEVLPYESFDTLKGGSLQERITQRRDGSTSTHFMIPKNEEIFIFDTTRVYNAKNLGGE